MKLPVLAALVLLVGSVALAPTASATSCAAPTSHDAVRECVEGAAREEIAPLSSTRTVALRGQPLRGKD